MQVTTSNELGSPHVSALPLTNFYLVLRMPLRLAMLRKVLELSTPVPYGAVDAPVPQQRSTIESF